MKLSPRTLQILENFANYNRGIILRPGNVIRSISGTKTCAMFATVDETFEQVIPIADIVSFLQVVKLYDAPEIEFSEHVATIGEKKNSKVKYHLANENLITSPPSGDIKMPSDVVTFTLTETDMQNLAKALQILKKPEILFTTENGKVVVSTYYEKDENGDSYSIDCDAVGADKFDVRLFIPVEHFKLIRGTYEVTLTDRIIRFADEDSSLVYWIGPHPRSTWK